MWSFDLEGAMPDEGRFYGAGRREWAALGALVVFTLAAAGLWGAVATTVLGVAVCGAATRWASGWAEASKPSGVVAAEVGA